MHADGVDYREEDYLLLSGIQHFAFCRRQWALIHLEHQWADNLGTIEGELLHERAHNAKESQLRGDVLTLRDLRVFSRRLGISGACDVVEFCADAGGVALRGRRGLWRPFPVEYKRGAPKAHRADELQLCAQALCLEEMLCCDIEQGALFYGETRRRHQVCFDAGLRQQLCDMVAEMHEHARRGHTPKVRPGKGCGACSLKDLCLPGLGKKASAAQWTLRRIGEEEPR